MLIECSNCYWVGEWETYEEAGYGYLCEVCAWADLQKADDHYLARGLAIIANALCSGLNLDFGQLVIDNQVLLDS